MIFKCNKYCYNKITNQHSPTQEKEQPAMQINTKFNIGQELYLCNIPEDRNILFQTLEEVENKCAELNKEVTTNED